MTDPQNQIAQSSATSLIGRVREQLKYSPRLVPDMSWTFANQVFVAISGVLVFKIISHWVTAPEYGHASLVLGMVALLNQLIVSPSILAHMRMYFEHAKEGRGPEYSRVVLRLLLRTALISSAIYAGIAIVYRSLGQPVYWLLLGPAVCLLLVQAQLTGRLAFIETEKRYRTLTVSYALSRVLQVPFLIVLIFTQLSRSAAVLAAQALSAGSVALFWAVKSLQQATATDEKTLTTREVAKSAAVAFGWSLYLFNFLSWVLTTSDRYVIEHFWSAREVGIYALNYGLWSVPYLSLNGWLEVARARMFERAEAKDWLGLKRLLRNRTLLAVVLGAALTITIYLAGKWIAFLIIGEHYWHSRGLMMLICSAHLFYIVAASFHGAFQAIKRTQVMVIIAAVTSALNLGMNIIVIPRFGIIGAGWSTLVAYAVMCIVTLVVGPIIVSRVANGGVNERG